MLKKLKFNDIKTLLIFLVLLPIGNLIKLFKNDVWLVSERTDEAKDNGFWFYKYVHDNNLHNNTYYVISRDAKDYEKVQNITPNRVIRYGSLLHYLLYVISNKHISAHIGGGMINSRVTKILEKSKLLSNKEVFLQHGVTSNTIEWAFKKNAKIDLFCCSSIEEMEFVREKFGYNDNWC